MEPEDADDEVSDSGSRSDSNDALPGESELKGCVVNDEDEAAALSDAAQSAIDDSCIESV